jgi:hypothetical protein
MTRRGPRGAARFLVAIHASDTLRASTTHSYDAAGAYEVGLSIGVIPCSPYGDGRPFTPAPPYGASVTGCVEVGSGLALLGGCRP